MPDTREADPHVERWIEWLEGDLYQSVTALVYQMHTYRSFNDMMNYASEDSKRNGWFHNWVRLNYRDALLAALRRQGTSRSDERSLLRFLKEVEANAQVLTCEWKASDARNDMERLVLLGEWDDLSVESGQHVDPAVVRRDIETLEAGLRVVKEWATHHVAHLLSPDMRDAVQTITYEDMHSAVGVIWHLYRRWRIIMTATVVIYPDPVKWEDVLASQWIEEEDARSLHAARRAEAAEASGLALIVPPVREQCRNDRTVAAVVNEAMVRGPDGTIPPEQLLRLLGIDREILPVPEHIRRWVEAESVVT